MADKEKKVDEIDDKPVEKKKKKILLRKKVAGL